MGGILSDLVVALARWDILSELGGALLRWGV